MDTIKLLKETNISYYRRLSYNTSKKKITLYSWLTRYSNWNKDNILKIREMNKIDKIQAKKMKNDLLPCVTISATFDSYRRLDLVDERNAIICIDIDQQDNEDIKDWDKVKKDVFKIKGVFLSSYSCRGEGIYVLVYYDMNKDFLKIWNSLKKDFKEICNLNIDKNCKDITRLRFISYDNDIKYINEVEMYDKEVEEKIEISNDYDNIELQYSDDFLYQAIYYLIIEDKYRANDYNKWLLDAFRLSTFGVYGQLLFLLLSKESDNFDYDNALKQFKECKKRNKMNKTSLLYYLKELKERHGDNWYNIINEYNVDN